MGGLGGYPGQMGVSGGPGGVFMGAIRDHALTMRSMLCLGWRG